MKLLQYKPLLEVAIFSTAIFLGNKLALFFLKIKINLPFFLYSPEKINGFFFICSLLIVFVLLKINQKNHDNVGYVFLVLTCIKMGISFYVMQPILNSLNPNNSSEKYNFFLLFVLYLTLETIVTIRILNRKQ